MKVIVSVGGRFHAPHIAEALQKRGYLKKIITTSNIAGIYPILIKTIPIAEYVGYGIKMIPGSQKILPWNLIKDNLFDYLASFNVDKCDIFHGFSNYSLLSLRKARKYSAKIIIERGSSHILTQNRLLVEEYEKYNIKHTPIHKWIIYKQLKEYEEADYVSIPSDFVRQSFLDHGFEEEKLIQNPYGVDLEKFRYIPKNDDVFRMIFVGITSFQKGIQYLLEAVNQLNLKNSELILIGGIENQFKDILKKYKGKFKYLGSIDHNELVNYYSNSSVYVHPSIQDGSGMVVTEAMACGLPVIISENTGAKDCVRNGKDGFIIPIRDVKTLKQKIQYFYDNPEERERMGKNAREQAMKYTWKKYQESLIKKLEEVVNENDKTKV